MYPAKSGLVVGFHGCDLAIRNKLVGGRLSLRPSNNLYDWLGHGIYFWENNYQRALDFAAAIKLRKGRTSKIRKPSVVGAILDIGNCLDLLDAEYIRLVRESYENLEKSFNLLNIALPANVRLEGSSDLLLRNLDCAVVQNLHVKRQDTNLRPFDSVRCAFIEGNPLYSNAGFHEKNHIQICIRNPNCIKGYFLPLEANDGWPIP